MIIYVCFSEKQTKLQKLQIAMRGTESTVTIETGKKIHRKLISGTITSCYYSNYIQSFVTEKRKQEKAKEIGTPLLRRTDCLTGLDAKSMQWKELLQNVLNEKRKIVKNEKTISDWESKKERWRKTKANSRTMNGQK